MDKELLDDYFTRPLTAKQLGTSVRTLVRWEERQEGPPITRISRSVYYKKSSLKNWLNQLEENKTKPNL